MIFFQFLSFKHTLPSDMERRDRMIKKAVNAKQITGLDIHPNPNQFWFWGSNLDLKQTLRNTR
jgi:hypothetical protein